METTQEIIAPYYVCCEVQKVLQVHPFRSTVYGQTDYLLLLIYKFGSAQHFGRRKKLELEYILL